MGETPQQVTTFINQFMVVKGDFPKSEFRVLEWIHSFEKSWWSRMVSFVLDELKELLMRFRLYIPVRTVQYGIPHGNHHFFAILERYNPETCTFFIPVREIRFALHEMYKVSGLVMEDLPYEEYISTIEELQLMKKDAPLVYGMYWEVLCHFQCLNDQVEIWRNQVDGLSKV